MDWETQFDSDLWDAGAKRASAQLGTIRIGMDVGCGDEATVGA